MSLTKEEYINALYCIQESDDVDVRVDAREKLEKLIQEHFDNPPLKFEELKGNMWVWDNVLKDYVKFKRNDDRKIGKTLIFSKNDGEEYIRFYRENSFYRREVKE